MSPHRLLVAVPVALVLCLGASSVSAQQPVPTAAPAAQRAEPGESPLDLAAGSVVADGRIDQLVRDDDVVYASGGFQTIGRYDGPGDVLDGTTGEPMPSPDIADGQISVVVTDGAGGWYLGGDFSRIGGEPAGGLAHVRADGTLDPAFLPLTDGLVSAIALQGTTLYVGGDFREVDDVARKHLAAVSTVDGSLLPFEAPQPERVTELVVSPTTLFVGSDRVVAVDPVTGAPVPTFTSPAHDPGGVHALTLGGGRLYVGTDELVSLDPVTGAVDPAFDPPGLPEDYRSYHALLWADSVLYAGSDRSARLLALDGSTGEVVPGFAPELTGENGTFGGPGGVYDLALDGDRLWVAGSFTAAGGAEAHGLAVLDAATGAREDDGLPTYNQQVNAVELAGSDVYVGGTFFMTDWTVSNGIAALDADTLEPLPGFRVRPYAIGDLIVAPSAVYVAPTHFEGFDNRSGSPHYFYDYTSRIRAFDPETGAQLDDLTLRVRNLTGATVIGDRFYVARRLDRDERFPRNRVDVYDATGRHVHSFAIPLRGYVTTLSSIGGDLVVAGSFRRSTSAGSPRNTAMLRLDPRTGARRTSFDPRIHGPVYDVVAQGGSLFASGLFKEVYQGVDMGRPGIVKLTARSRKDETFAPHGFAANRVLMRLHAVGDLLFVEGSRQRFLDLGTGEQVDSPTGGPAYAVRSIATAPGGGYYFSSEIYPNVGGRDPLPLGFIAPTGS